MHLHLKIFCNH